MIRVFLLLIFHGVGASEIACSTTKQDEPASLMQALMRHNKATLSKKIEKPRSQTPVFAPGLPGAGLARGVVPPSPPDPTLMQEAFVIASSHPPLSIPKDESKKRLGLLGCGSLVSDKAPGGNGTFIEECADCGCYVRSPNGCPNHPEEAADLFYWMRDDWGETHHGAREYRKSCVDFSRVHYSNYCGVEDVLMEFVVNDVECPAPEVPPVPPGCYVRTPSGCINFPDAAYNSSWSLDVWARENTQAFECELDCTVCRKTDIDMFCGVNDTETLWIGSPDPETGVINDGVCTGEPPEKCGCWIKQGSGCPEWGYEVVGGHTCWVRDLMGEKIEEDAAGYYPEACQTIRRQRWDQTCGTSDAQAHWNTCELGLEPRPVEPGCYVQMPAGCHCECYNETTSEGIIHNGWKWVKDEFGEQNAEAGYYEKACTENRYWAWNEYCSVREELSWDNPDERPDMLFIPRPDVGADPLPPNPGCYIRALQGCPHDGNIERMAMHWIELEQNVCREPIPGSNCSTDPDQCMDLKPIYEQYCQNCGRFNSWRDCNSSYEIEFTFVWSNL